MTDDYKISLNERLIIRSLARIILLLGKGIGNPLVRNIIGEKIASEVQVEVESIKVYSRDL